MKLKITLLLYLFSSSIYLVAQVSNPAQVSKPIFWLLAKEENNQFEFENRGTLTEAVSNLASDGETLNFNPALNFDASSAEMSLSLTQDQIKQQTLFMVYKLKDSIAEQYLWNLSDSTTTQSLTTSKRLVNLDTYKFKTYATSISPNKANIHFYQHNRSDLTSSNYQLTLGNTTSTAELPPTPLQASIAEIIMYNRVLTPTESQKVGSYLAIKYGISLSQSETKNYLNSEGSIIWNQSKHKGFENNITAIGRDDKSQLLQLKSSNSFEKELLTIGFTPEKDSISDNYFVFWSDNNQSLSFKKEEGQPKSLARKWILDYQEQTDLGLTWEFDPSQITNKDSLDTDLYYWLKIDSSGTGDFDTDNLEYLKLQPVTTTEKLTLTDYDWDQSGNGKVAFSLAIAPKMFANVEINEPTCSSSKSGSLNFKIEGGTAPYQISLLNTDTTEVVQKWSQESSTADNLAIDSGTYDYSVVDADNNQYQQTLYVSNVDAVEADLESSYVISDTSDLYLDASLNLPDGVYSYEWYYEDTLMSTYSLLAVQKTGDYELHLETSEGCKSVSKISVTSESEIDGSETKTMLYPNPTKDGNFTVYAWFPDATSSSLSIYNIVGQLVKSQNFSSNTAIEYQGYLNTSGIYFIKINSFYGEETIKLMVQ
jgi:hypothetical protein